MASRLIYLLVGLLTFSLARAQTDAEKLVAARKQERTKSYDAAMATLDAEMTKSQTLIDEKKNGLDAVKTRATDYEASLNVATDKLCGRSIATLFMKKECAENAELLSLEHYSERQEEFIKAIKTDSLRGKGYFNPNEIISMKTLRTKLSSDQTNINERERAITEADAAISRSRIAREKAVRDRASAEGAVDGEIAYMRQQIRKEGILRQLGDMDNSIGDINDKLTIAQLEYDNAALGDYLMEKFGRLLSSKTLCQSVKDNNCEKPITGKDLETVFPEMDQTKYGRAGRTYSGAQKASTK